MNTYIALFRGMNVGGHNLLPMNELVRLLENLGLRNVKTYIQSGNAVFQSEKIDTGELTDRILAKIDKIHGVTPHLLVLELDELIDAIASNPYLEAETEPKTLNITFLFSVPKSPDLKTLESIKKDSERFTLKGKVFYLHAPEGIAKSKLAARIEKSLGVPGTTRNWRTVCKITEMAKQCG